MNRYTYTTRCPRPFADGASRARFQPAVFFGIGATRPVVTIKSLAVFFVWMCLCQATYAQLVVDGNQTDAQLARLISGEGVSISNVFVDCQGVNPGKAHGHYSVSDPSLSITEGLLLTTGSINNAVGPNTSASGSYFFKGHNSLNSPTNPTIVLLEEFGRYIGEFCEFTFDIIPLGDTLKFDYMFASEEYNEFVGSDFNDVFGFFITGPNPEGGNFTNRNIAIIPTTGEVVAINTVNNGVAQPNGTLNGPCKNCEYFQDNANGSVVAYDGFTKNLRAISRVTPCQTYRLKLVVADASDGTYDSGVFIEKISSPPPVSITSTTVGGGPFVIEECNPATVTFKREVATAMPHVVTYFISGTAANGTDYPAIGPTGTNNPKTITIPASQQSASFTLNATADGLDEGTETVILSLDNPGCPANFGVSDTLAIRDSILPSLTPTAPFICRGQSVTLTGTALGGSTFAWAPGPGCGYGKERVGFAHIHHHLYHECETGQLYGNPPVNGYGKRTPQRQNVDGPFCVVHGLRRKHHHGRVGGWHQISPYPHARRYARGRPTEW